MENFINKHIDDIKIPVLPAEFYNHENSNEIRIAKIYLFYQYLCRHKEFAGTEEKKQYRVINSLERSCYSITLDIANKESIPCNWDINEFDDLYHIVCARVLSYFTYDNGNIKSAEKTNNIITSLLNDVKCAKSLPFKKRRELYPEEYETVDERYNANKQIRIKTSKLRTCPRCKQQLSTVKNRYNRSLDEGVNLEATCIFCEFSWNC